MTTVRKKVIVIISFSFSIRYIVRTGFLEKLSTFCEPIILITWNEVELIEELRHKGFSVILHEPISTSNRYHNIRRKIDYWFIYHILKSPSTKIQANLINHYFKKTILAKVSNWYNILITKFASYTNNLFREEENILTNEEAFIRSKNLLKDINADAVFTVTPFHKQEDFFLRACKDQGLKMLTAILSFDNTTKRGWIPVEYDKYLVWNKYNKSELQRIYSYIKPSQISITGAPQFDFYKNPKFILTKDQWMESVGITNKSTQKIILYSGGPPSLFPNETDYVDVILKSISTNKIHGNPILLFRCHPVDKIERWLTKFKFSKNIFFEASWTGKEKLGLANVTDHDISKLCSTLYYTDVHINLCSTMTIDGSAFNKPQIGPAFDLTVPSANRKLKKMYYQEHFIPIMNIQGLAIANSANELIELINQALTNPETMIQKCKQVVAEIITYDDGESTDRVVGEVKLALQ